MTMIKFIKMVVAMMMMMGQNGHWNVRFGSEAERRQNSAGDLIYWILGRTDESRHRGSRFNYRFQFQVLGFGFKNAVFLLLFLLLSLTFCTFFVCLGENLRVIIKKFLSSKWHDFSIHCSKIIHFWLILWVAYEKVSSGWPWFGAFLSQNSSGDLPGVYARVHSFSEQKEKIGA